MNQSKYKNSFKNLLRKLAMLAGTFGLFTWIYISDGDPESDDIGAPIIGWEVFDDWRDFDQWWNFYLAPIAAFVIPALLVLLTGYLGKFIFSLIGSHAPAQADDQSKS